MGVWMCTAVSAVKVVCFVITPQTQTHLETPRAELGVTHYYDILLLSGGKTTCITILPDIKRQAT